MQAATIHNVWLGRRSEAINEPCFERFERINARLATTSVENANARACVSDMCVMPHQYAPATAASAPSP